MTLDEMTADIRARVGSDSGLGKVVKFNLGQDGLIRIDGASRPNAVDNEDTAADCVLTISAPDLIEVGAGRRNPQTLFMLGRMKVTGDYGLALKVGRILGRRP